MGWALEAFLQLMNRCIPLSCATVADCIYERKQFVELRIVECGFGRIFVQWGEAVSSYRSFGIGPYRRRIISPAIDLFLQRRSRISGRNSGCERTSFWRKTVPDAMNQKFEKGRAIQAVMQLWPCTNCDARALLIEVYTSEGYI